MRRTSPAQRFGIERILKGNDVIRDFSVIAIVRDATDGKNYILKVEKYPGWSVVWEYRVAYCIQQYLPFVQQFSRVNSIQTMSFLVDKEDRVLPDLTFATPTTDLARKMKRSCWTTVSEFVPGQLFSEVIKTASYRRLFSGIFQVLISLFCAQKLIHLTHYDAHPGNMIAQEVSKEIVYLFDVVPAGKAEGKSDRTKAIMVWSEGLLLKLIDFEYTYVSGFDGKSFDAKLDLLSKGYNPSRPDPGYDCLRFIVSTLSYYGELHRDANVIRIRDLIVSTFNNNTTSRKNGTIDNTGVILNMRDEMRNRIFGDPELKQALNERQLHFLKSYYYQILHLITHNLECPITPTGQEPIFTKENDAYHLSQVTLVFRLIFYVTFEHPTQILRILYHICDLIHERRAPSHVDNPEVEKHRVMEIAKTVASFLRNNEELENNYIWVLQLRLSLEAALPSFQYMLQSSLKNVSDERIHHQNAQEFTPIKMFNLLNKEFYSQRNVFTRSTIVHWMNRRNLEIVDFSKLQISDSELVDLNNVEQRTISERSECLKLFLERKAAQSRFG